jgi:hypothetical protein
MDTLRLRLPTLLVSAGLAVAATFLLVAPLAFLMGVPMAAGMALVGDRPLLRLWGFSLNGVLSVVASVGALLLAVHAGIAAAFGVGVASYAAAGGLLLYMESRRTALPDEAAAPLAGEPQRRIA